MAASTAQLQNFKATEMVSTRFLQLVISVVCSLASVAAFAQPASRTARARIYKDRIEAHWSQDNNRFWYRNELPEGSKEFVVVDCERGIRKLAFDHAVMARQIGDNATPHKLPVQQLAFAEDEQNLYLLTNDKAWLWEGTKGELKSVSLEEAQRHLTGNYADASARPRISSASTEMVVENRMTSSIELFWLPGDGSRQTYGKVEPGAIRRQHTYGGHRWLIQSAGGEDLGEIVAYDEPRTIVVNGKLPTARGERSRARSRERRASASSSPAGRSPDGKWSARIDNHNIVLEDQSSGRQIGLTDDGREDLSYSELTWSQDSKVLIAFRKTNPERLKTHLIRSSPAGGGRAQLESREYALPGDEFPKFELNIFHVTSSDRKRFRPEVDRFESEWQRPSIRWSPDGQCIRYEQIDRGHQRFRVIEVNVHSGAVRSIVDEHSPTFIWTAHLEGQAEPVHWLKQTDELIYVTERSGWRHLELIDIASGSVKNPITSGKWVVRSIERIDEDKRQVWFRACGVFDQDPYLMHFGRVNFDGSDLVWLTRGNGNHSVSYSPDRRYLIDTYSRVDQAPKIELRRTEDGSLVCDLEQADVHELAESGWTGPEVFTAKGRDGRTDIWGFVCKPKNFDPKRKYPVIEDIYAGPHGSHVPKSFSAADRYHALTEMGFFVVKIDGMGTANRSKAFHDVCWHNLKDAGFPDRILWMKSVAEKIPQMDLDRVGIYGTSAGGQNAASAVLHHPEFYKVAVAACGCHDNRMDKASWNEQWMGYPVDAHYASNSNIDNAQLLQGKLLLIVGEMDTNVPPESTMRFADALIRADKDFDLLVVPNAGHGMGGTYGQNRMHKFFEQHLQGN